MNVPADISVDQTSRRFSRACPSRAMRRDWGHRCLAMASLLLKGLVTCAFAAAFLTFPVPAQQPAGPPPPGWPTSSTMPDHGHAPTDAMISPLPRTARPDGSCSLWASAGTHGATISAATLKVPEKTRDKYRRACGDLKRKKLADAEDLLRTAVHEYPSYTAAWVLLGEVLEKQRRIEEAQGACAQASSVDSNYTQAYLCLADVAAQQEQWKQTLDRAARALALDPLENVYGYFYSAVAQYHLSDLPAAEKNAQKTVDADHFHLVPQAYLLLAQIYGANHDLHGAAIQLRAYLKVAPHSPDSGRVRKSLAELEAQITK